MELLAQIVMETNFNGIILGTFQHEMCLVFNYIIGAEVT